MYIKSSILKLRFGITKLKTNTQCLRYFRLQILRNCMLVKSVLEKPSIVTFGIAFTSWKVGLQCKVTGGQSKAYQAVSRMLLTL